MITWPAGVFHRIISGEDGSVSINFATRLDNFNIDDNFNIYDLNKSTGNFRLLKDGVDDQPNLYYEYPNNDIKKLVKDM